MKRENITFTMNPVIVDQFKKYCENNAFVPSKKLELMITDVLKEERSNQEDYIDSILKTKKLSNVSSIILELINKKAIINIDIDDFIAIVQSGLRYEVKSGSFNELFKDSKFTKKYVSVLIILECPPKFYLSDAQMLLEKITSRFNLLDLNIIYAARTNEILKKPLIHLLLVR